jgi:hypothetical protein
VRDDSSIQISSSHPRHFHQFQRKCQTIDPAHLYWQKDFMALHGQIKISSVAFSPRYPLSSFLPFPFWSSPFCFCPGVDFFQPYSNNCSYLPKKDWPISSQSLQLFSTSHPLPQYFFIPLSPIILPLPAIR